MIKVNTREQKSHPDWKSLELQPIGLSMEQLGLTLKELHKISK